MTPKLLPEQWKNGVAISEMGKVTGGVGLEGYQELKFKMSSRSKFGEEVQVEDAYLVVISDRSHQIFHIVLEAIGLNRMTFLFVSFYFFKWSLIYMLC